MPSPRAISKPRRTPSQEGEREVRKPAPRDTRGGNTGRSFRSRVQDGRASYASSRGETVRTVAEKASEVSYKIRALQASSFIFWTLLPLYTIQFFVWVFGLGSIALETIPLANYVIPGEEGYIFSYVIIGVLGLFSMFLAGFVYSARGISWFGGTTGLAFAFCLAGYFIFFLNLFPWVGIWMLIVIFAKPQEEGAG